MAPHTKTVVRWALTALWASLPFTAGPLLADALDGAAGGFRTAVSVALWLLWAALLTATLVPRVVTLTIVRIGVPASLLATIWAAVASPDPGAAAVVGITVTVALAGLALAPATAEAYVDGSSYGDERRFPLRAPGLWLLGPIELAWLAAVVGATAGPLLVANGSIVVGVAATVVGWPVAYVAVRSLHVLATRWLVFTKAGIVVADRVGMNETLLVQHHALADLEPAPADTDALDLTAGALGLALQLRFTSSIEVVPGAPRGTRSHGAPAAVTTSAVLVSPTRPGAVLHEAADRGMPIGGGA